MLEHEMSLSTQQMTTISRWQIQSISILQMDVAQLEEYLTRQMEENPLIDMEDAIPEFSEMSVWKAEEFRPFSPGRTRGEQGLTALDYAAARDESDSLLAFLRDQLERRNMPDWQRKLCVYIAGFLDERGYLVAEDVNSLYRDLAISKNLIDRSISVLQSLEPAGVAARDMRECLLLQLQRRKEPCETATRIVDGYLNELGQKKFAMLSKKLKKPIEVIYHAAAQIRALDPKPGSAFQTARAVPYVRPDISVVLEDMQLRVIVHDMESGRFVLNRDYVDMEKSLGDEEAKAYLREKISQAKWIFSCLQHRNSTLDACVRCIVERQRDFFLNRSRQLRPLTLDDIAGRVGLHKSTVCRALQGKYLLCAAGVFPLNYFFSNPVASASGSEISASSVKEMISALTKKEDKTRPLSDQQIQELLKEQENILISRRTVAKYRTALMIPPANKRRAAVCAPV